MLQHEKERAYKEAYLAAISGYLANRFAKEASSESTANIAHKTADALAKKYIKALEEIQSEGSPL